MKDYELYIFDLDGVIYREGVAIESAINFINRKCAANKDIYYITNNSTKTENEVYEKLVKYGIKKIKKENIITSGMATKEYLKKHLKISRKNRVLCVTEEAVKDQLREIGCKILDQSQYKEADFVVVGETDFIREDLYYAVNAIKHYGAFFIGTNGDVTDPALNGESKPVAGAILAYIKACTGIEPKIMGKPYPEVYEMILKESGISKNKILMLGDRLDTDIVGANELGIDTALIETGIHKKEDCELLRIHPTYIISDLEEFEKSK